MAAAGASLSAFMSDPHPSLSKSQQVLGVDYLGLCPERLVSDLWAGQG